MKLGDRLATLASCVPQGAVVADIGTDHAYLPIALVLAGRITKAVAGDVVKGPYQAALAAVEAAGYTKEISVRLGNGLDVLTPGEVDTAVIAGMGGATIVEILSAAPEIVGQMKRLILQPMVAGEAVRRWLAKAGWHLLEEHLVEDNGRIYEIIVAQPGIWSPIEDVLYEVGPLLWQQRHPLLRRQLEQMIRQLTAVTRQMEESDKAVREEKYAICSKRLQALKEKLTCL
ncbi:class I SAM-dependent methyltransferase [Azotosporobacter soli]|uniref:tRNA (adenine(22)-N(1))-methyltransferase n=1 Tax=Azotosporobacter soli TaxID=3055040 RepID=UPI0031FF380C